MKSYLYIYHFFRRNKIKTLYTYSPVTGAVEFTENRLVYRCCVEWVYCVDSTCQCRILVFNTRTLSCCKTNTFDLRKRPYMPQIVPRTFLNRFLDQIYESREELWSAVERCLQEISPLSNFLQQVFQL